MDISLEIWCLLGLVCIFYIPTTSEARYSRDDRDCFVYRYRLARVGYVYVPSFDFVNRCVPCHPSSPCYLYFGRPCRLRRTTKMSVYAYIYRPFYKDLISDIGFDNASKENFKLLRNVSVEHSIPPFKEGEFLFLPISEILFIGPEKNSIKFFSFLKYQGLLPMEIHILYCCTMTPM